MINKKSNIRHFLVCRFVIDDLYYLQASKISEKSDFNKLT